MSLQATLQRPNAAETFERVIVPGIFDRYARALVERARPIGPSDRILDLGCGTGIVSRVLRERLGGGASIVGLDVSAPMLAVARAVAPELEFIEGDATALPFPDGSFELVLSQQMLQFVPDRLAALREVRRVLSPGGRLIATTWRARGEQPLHDALGRVAERHLGASRDKRWALDGTLLASELEQAGFGRVQMDTESLDECFLEFPLRMNAMAAGFDLSAWSDDEREERLSAMERESEAVLARFALDAGVGAPSITNVATAFAPAA